MSTLHRLPYATAQNRSSNPAVSRTVISSNGVRGLRVDFLQSLKRWNYPWDTGKGLDLGHVLDPTKVGGEPL